MKKMFGILGALGLGLILAFYAGIQIGQRKTTVQTAKGQEIRTIAIVNMDQGIELESGIINYGTKLLSLSDANFSNTSLEDARTGIENGKYAAYLIVPTNFSKQVWSINSEPEKAVLEYAVNPNLKESLVPDIVYELKGFEMKLNTDISYLYLYSILQEFHTSQNSAETILQNDRKDMENLISIAPENLLLPLEFVELQPSGEYPADVNLDNNYQNIAYAIREMETQYDTYASKAKWDLEEVMEKGKTVQDAVYDFRTSVSDVDLIKDENGTFLYQEGQETLMNEVGKYNSILEDERTELTDALLWLGRHESVASPSEAGEANHANTWLDEIRVEQEKQMEDYNKNLDEWKESFDYTKLATPSEADLPGTGEDPPKATAGQAKMRLSGKAPAKATPGEAESNWLEKRDIKVVMLSMDGIFDRIDRQLDAISMDDDVRDDVKMMIWDTYRDEDILGPIVASAGSAYPVSGNPMADRYIKEFLSAIPRLEGSLGSKISEVGSEISEFSQQQVDYLEDGVTLPADWFDRLFEDSFIRKLEGQERYVQELLTSRAEEFEKIFEEYNKELKEYTPLTQEDQEELSNMQSVIGRSVSEIQDQMNNKTRRDQEYIQNAEERHEKELTALRDNLDQSYEGTARNLKETLNYAKDNRKQLNQENEELLSDFTKKLPYTRNGSLAATDAYDVIVNPVTAQKREAKGGRLVVNGQEFHVGVGWLTGVLALAVVLLFTQNVRLGRRAKKLREEQEGQ